MEVVNSEDKSDCVNMALSFWMQPVNEHQQNFRDEFLHRGFRSSETRIWGRILETYFGRPYFGPEFLGRFF